VPPNSTGPPAAVLPNATAPPPQAPRRILLPPMIDLGVFNLKSPPPAMPATPPGSSPPPSNQSMNQTTPEQIADGVGTIASVAVATTAGTALVPRVLSTVAAATSAGSVTSSSTATLGATGTKGLSALAAKGSSAVAKGAGGGLLMVLDQMQGAAASGSLAPVDMLGYQTVAAAAGWTTHAAANTQLEQDGCVLMPCCSCA
jgi:hypothetical protein